VDLSTNGNIIVGGSTPAVVTGANLAGTNLSATAGNGTLVLNVDDSFITNDADDTMVGVLTIDKTTSATNSVTDVLILKSQSSGSISAAGTGVGVSLQIENNASEVEECGNISSFFETSTNGSEKAGLLFKTRSGGSMVSSMRVSGKGEILSPEINLHKHLYNFDIQVISLSRGVGTAVEMGSTGRLNAVTFDGSAASGGPDGGNTVINLPSADPGNYCCILFLKKIDSGTNSFNMSCDTGDVFEEGCVISSSNSNSLSRGVSIANDDTYTYTPASADTNIFSMGTILKCWCINDGLWFIDVEPVFGGFSQLTGGNLTGVSAFSQ